MQAMAALSLSKETRLPQVTILQAASSPEAVMGPPAETAALPAAKSAADAFSALAVRELMEGQAEMQAMAAMAVTS
ncbi:MAG: hypothetical protein L0219_20105 [Phycisphaerales bacterium]|nr:hypothetical protein [Phycisphaerales bacterium]